MYKNLRRNKGITLVALVLTIIILLILAGISISALTNQGLFTQAQNAKTETEIANIKEQIQLDIYEKQLINKGNISDKELEDILKDYGDIIYEEDGGTIKGIITKKEEYEILLSDIYSGTTTKTKILLADKVQPGEYVTYTPDQADTTDILSELTTYSGSTANTSSTLTQETELKWRVLDVVDGKVRLISELPTTSTVTFSSYNGYNNAVYLLDKTCKTLYSKAGYSENVQNLKIEDIQKYMTITDYSTINSNYGKTFSPTTKTYPSIFAQEEGQKVNGTTGTLGSSKQISPITGKNDATSWTVKYTCWKKTMAESDFANSIYYNIFINNGNNYETYWMSSRCVYAESLYADYFVRIVKSGDVEQGDLYGSGGAIYSNTYAFRPVITLNSNALVIKGNGTLAIPYEIGL